MEPLQDVADHYGTLQSVVACYGSTAEELWGVAERYGTLREHCYRTVKENINATHAVQHLDPGVTWLSIID